MANAKNIFVSHFHGDAHMIENLNHILGTHGMQMKDSSIYENKNPNNATNEDYIKSLIHPKIKWAGTVVVLIGKDTHKSDYVNWEIECAEREEKRIVGVYLPGEDDSKLPDAFEKHGDALRHWNGNSIIDAINGDDTWEGPSRNWETSHSTC